MPQDTDAYEVWHWICSQCRRDNLRLRPPGYRPLPLLREACDRCGATVAGKDREQGELAQS